MIQLSDKLEKHFIKIDTTSALTIGFDHVQLVIVMLTKAWRVVGRLEGDQTQAEVAQSIGVSQSVLSMIWNRFLETGSAG
ncbi:hypothetical protein TNCV_143471 [Trichonephila clavipes]|nr:hypothetical protein TNCV_143471 [Trichonephila clavipes]